MLRASQLTRRGFLAGLATLSAGAFSARQCVAQPSDQSKPDSMLTSQARQAIRSGLDYIAGQQNEDGSFGTRGYSRNVAVCSLCGMAFMAHGSSPGRGRYGVQIKQLIRFVLGSVEDSGFIVQRDAAGRGPMYGHGFATLFLSEVYGMSLHPDLRAKLAGAVKLIVGTQNAEGGWRYDPRRDEADLSVTVCQVMALRAARNAGLYVPNQTIDRAVEYVKKCQNADGGFMYMLSQGGDSEFPRSAAALVSLYSAGIYEGDEIERGIKYLMQFPPGVNKSGQQSYYMYGHYYAVQAMWHAGGRYWNSWYPAIRDALLAQQHAEGFWLDAISREYSTAMACLVLQMPDNYLPIFQR